ncbi:MFS transporter [Corynebacterium breve]|uniref:MFS transporter n=1 Tax=Corynebacterium breve TaxID=3049799 RepID=A0ABY8VDT9_9CORY|nr:MFS transporter [Corynebacterium breve]WIM67841.1 MFS transporter [Corynebacterium breve]
MREIFADTRPLQVPAYRKLWIANILTQLGAQMTVVAVPAQIYALTDSSGYVGLTGLFGLVPLVIFGLYGGSIADAFDKRKVLIVSTLGMIITSGAFFVVTALGQANVWLLLSIFALQQAFFAVNQPTRTAVFRSILPFDQLAAGASLNMMVMQAGAIVGPLVAGALIPFVGYSWIYLIDVACLVPTLGAVLTLPSLPPTGPTEAPGLRSIGSGLRYLWAQPVLLIAMLLDAIAMVFGMPRALYPEMAAVDFGGSPLMLSLLYSSIALGAVVGGLFSGWVSRVIHQGKAVALCIVVWGGAIVLAGLFTLISPPQVSVWAWLVVGMLVIGGAADMFSASLRNAILQQSATTEMQGRVQGVYIIIVVGGPRIADIAHGWAAEFVSTGWTTLIGGVLVIAGTAVSMLLVPRFWTYKKPLTD